MRFASILGAAVVLIAAPSCTADIPESSRQEKTSPKQASSDLWSPVPPNNADLSRVGFYGGKTEGGGTAAIAAVSSSNRLVTSISPGAGSSGPLLTGTTQMGWLLGGKPTALAAPKPPGPSQLVAADVYNETVIWRETRSTNLDTEDWRILVQSPETGSAARVVASYDDYYDADVVPMFNDDRQPIALVDDRAYWSIRDWPTDAPSAPQHRHGLYPDRPTYRILSSPLNGSGKIQQVAHGAYGPSRSGDHHLLYIADDRLRTGRTSGTARVVENDGSTSQTIYRTAVTSHSSRITMTCGTTSYIAWAATIRGKDEIRILLRGESKPRRMSLRSTGGSTEISCGDNFVAWGRGSGRGDANMYLYDIPSKKKTTLGTTKAYARVHAQGDALAYPDMTNGSQPARWVIATWSR